MSKQSTIADRLAAILERHGCIVRRTGSALSTSRYVYASTEDGDEIKIRIADHVARPTYERDHGAADIEVGNHDMASRSGALDAAGAALSRLGVPPDARFRASVAMAAGRAAKAARIEEAERASIVDTWRIEADAKDAAIIAWNPGRWAEIRDLPGKKGKEKRRVFRRQAEVALGLTK